MTPTWESDCGTVRLWRGDCLEILPTWPAGAVDAVVTDPPYGVDWNANCQRFSGGSSASIKKRGGGGARRPVLGDDQPFNPGSILSVGREHVIWGWNNFPDKLPRGACLVWIKRNDEAFGSFLSDAETAWFSRGCGVYCFKDLSNNGIAKQRAHPTQKPVPLMEWCIGRVTGQTIADPFMGSGTTGVAAVRLGRKFWGIELDEQYFEIAKRRIQDELRKVAFRVPKTAERQQQYFVGD